MARKKPEQPVDDLLTEPGPLVIHGRRGCHLSGASLDERPADFLWRALGRMLAAMRTINSAANGGIPGLKPENCRWLTRIVARRANDLSVYLQRKDGRGRSRYAKELCLAADRHSTPIETPTQFGVSFTELALNFTTNWIERLRQNLPPQRNELHADDIDACQTLSEVLRQITPNSDEMEYVACGLEQEWKAIGSKLSKPKAWSRPESPSIIAKQFGISLSTLKRRIDDGNIEVKKITPKLWCFRETFN